MFSTTRPAPGPRRPAALRAGGCCILLAAMCCSPVLTACKAARPPVPRADPGPKPAVPDPCPLGNQPVQELRLGAALLGSPSVLLEGYGRVAEHLSQATGIPVTLVAANDYAEMTERLETGDIEVAILPPLEYLSAKERIPCLNASLTTIQDGHVHYTGYLVVRADSGIRDVRRLSGRSIGFVSPNSASGDLFPRVRLLADGLMPERDMARVDYLGSHLAVIDAVLDGTVDAGATFDAGLELARREGREVGALAILAITGRIPLEAIVIIPTLDTALVKRLVDAFAALNTANPEGRRTLAPLGTICGYARSDDRFYDEVRSTLNAFRRLGGESR